MKWFFVFLDKDKEFSIEFCKTIHEIFLDGFGLEKGWSIERIRNERLKKSSILGLLKDNNNFHGYAFYTIPDVLLDGFHVLWEDAICIKKEHQGKGYSKSILTSICELYPNFKFGWFGGRTQNPIMMKRYAKSGKTYPFDVDYQENDGKILFDFLLKHIAEVKNSETLDIRTGICHNVYKERKLGKYPDEIKGTFDYEVKLHRWAFNRNNGDAVIVVSKLTKQLDVLLQN